ncbi:type IV pilin protein [Nibricoccus sp. IMCC34717]|uniref:type IV pilin protein n=1 Tax=Nibricoccus sp. IMCC34717 TaxID=3034021 RepID=UPI00384CB4BC
MKNNKRLKTSGFTLVEVGVVLAIIGVLAAISIPSVSYFLRQGRVKSVVGSVNSVRNWIGSLQSSGAIGGALPITEGSRPPTTGAALTAQAAETVAAAARLDQVLVSAGITEKLLSFGMGNQASVAEGEGLDLAWSARKRAFFISDANGDASATATAARDWSSCSRLESRLSAPGLVPSAAGGANFRLDGATNLSANTVVAYVHLKEVPYKDALELAKALNGEGLLATNGTAQDAGPVVFAAPGAGASTTDVFVYIAAL